MRIQYLGTAAAEGIPSVFCTCELCRQAIENGGKGLRTRSQALINGDLLIDFPSDTYTHYLTNKFDLPHITDLLVTHSHRDHFCPSDLAMRRDHFAYPDPPVMRIYGNDSVHAAFYNNILYTAPAFHYFELVHVKPFVPFTIGRYEVIPFMARHDKKQECLIYGIKQKGSSLLYAHDTGYFPDETWDYLLKDRTCYSLVSLDCTKMAYKEGTNHMGMPDDIEVRQRLLDMGCADDHTTFVINHFSHNGGWTRAQLEEQAKQNGFIPAYDGLRIDF